MKTICWSNLAFLVLAAIYCPAQTTVATRSRTAAPVAVAAAAAVLEVTSSNAVQAVTRVRLQNQAFRSAGAARAATVVTFQGVSSNAMQVAPRVQLQNPALPATRMSVAGAQTRGLTPLTATIPDCVRPPGLVGWWPGEGDASDIIGGNAGTLQNGATCDTGEVGLAFIFNGDSQAVEIPYSTALATNCYSVEAWI